MSRPFTDGPDGAIHYGRASPPQQNLGVFVRFPSKQPGGGFSCPLRLGRLTFAGRPDYI